MELHAGYRTAPQALSMPPGFPFHISLCAVTTRNGCEPPDNLLSQRIAVGRGRTQREADLLAVAEAAERYSIQYSSDLPDRMDPVATLGGPPEPSPLLDLTLGAPGRRNGSAGAAAGRDPEHAAARAALETLEHLHLDRLRSGAGELAAVDLAGEAAIAPHVAWLDGQLRRLEVRARAFAPGYVVAVAACSDCDGGRRTEGSAARLRRGPAVRAAAEEAIFHWRNMVELERAAADLAAMPDDERARVARYRGAWPIAAWPAPEASDVGEHRGADLEGLLAAVLVLARRRVRLFDFTAPEVGVPVMRVHLG